MNKMNKILKVLCLLLLVPAVVYGRAWGQCGNDIRPPYRIRVMNCDADHDQACIVRRNQPSQIQVQFSTHHPSRQLNAQLHALVGNFWFPHHLGRHANVCNSLQVGRCPANANTQLIYTFGLTIPNRAPPNTQVLVRLQAANEQNHVQFCLLLRVLVQ